MKNNKSTDMIVRINHLDPCYLRQIICLQRASYEEEAKLIGSRDIPPLHETEADLSNVEEDFFGIYFKSDLVAFISIENSESLVVISRLVVSPSYFRKGYGKTLVSFVQGKFSGKKLIRVSTGKSNSPARALYEKMGFMYIGDEKVSDEINISKYSWERDGELATVAYD